MGKKKSKHAGASLPSSPPVPPPSELKSLIHDHSLFFDRLVELIPARFYLPSADDADRPWYQGLSKAAKASAKKETRLNIKKARRERLDPEKNSSTTLDLLKMSINAGNVDPPPSDDTPAFPKIPDDRSVTYEELRQRLRRKIEELKGNRNTRVTSERPRSGNDEKGEKGGSFTGKRGRVEGGSGEVAGNEAKKARKDDSGVDLSFGFVKIGEDVEKSGKRRGLSKKKALEKAKKLQESLRDPEKGEELRDRHSWKAAVSRAAGVKVHDDPRLIKESMKKEKKRKEKSAEKWKERVEVTGKLKAERQKKRAENIGEKIKKKKLKKIEKREKKLMRPGFEGRKEGYINAQ